MSLTRAYCPYCEREGAAEIERPNHVLHFLLTFFTGVWAFVWLVYSLDPAIHCRQCGGRLFNAKGRRNLWILGILMVLFFMGCIGLMYYVFIYSAVRR